MAQFCTKCGTPLPEGMKFCIGCGATIGEPSAPAVQAPAAPAPARPVAQAPAPAAPPAASSGSPAVKIVLIVLAVLILFGLLGVGGCVYFLYRAKQKMRQFETTIHSTFPVPAATPQVPTPPGAPVTAPGQPTAPAVDMGVPVYPGATATEGQGEMSLGVGGLKIQQYTTSDSVDKVVAFYKEKLGPNAMTTQSGNSALVQVGGSNGVINITIAPDSASGKTKFTITSIGKQ